LIIFGGPSGSPQANPPMPPSPGPPLFYLWPLGTLEFLYFKCGGPCKNGSVIKDYGIMGKELFLTLILNPIIPAPHYNIPIVKYSPTVT